VISATIDLGSEIEPYPGLRPFREDETHLYFGREQHRGELLKRLTATRFVAVIGTSGSGKSSLVRAGLLTDVLSGYLPGTGCDWIIVESRPGADPLGNMVAAFASVGWVTDAAALRTDSAHVVELATRHLSPGQHLLVLVDQFEELFRLKTSDDPVEDADEKAAFVRLLLNAGGQRADLSARQPCVHVVMAMRSEFLGRASVYRGLPEAIDQGQYLIPRLTREQLRRAIELPARVAGGELEEALVQRLLNELGDDQDQLPVLQHALMRCWQLKNDGDRIGLESYDRSGQLAGALSMDANDALSEARETLGAHGEQIARRAFQALRETDVNGGQTRRPTTVEELCDLASCTVDELTTTLAPFRRRSFVVPPPETALESSMLVDISHEALLRRWDTLRRWIDEDEQDRARYVRLAARAADEQSSDRPQYLEPPQLDLLVKFWADRNPSRLWAVRHHPGYEGAKAFLDESERRQLERERARREAEEAQHQQVLADAAAKRARIRRRVLVGSILCVTIAVVGGLALRNALRQGARLEALLLAARLENVPESNIEGRLQLAAEVARRRPDLDSLQELLRTLFVAPTPKAPDWGAGLGGDVGSVALSPDDRRLYAVTGDRLHMIELASGQKISVSIADSRGQGSSSSAPLLLTSEEKLLVLWNRLATVVDARTLSVVGERIPDARAVSVSSESGRAAFLASGVVTLCDLRSNCELRQQHDVEGTSGVEPWSPSDLELSADGRTLVIIGDPTGSSQRRRLAVFNTEPWAQRNSRHLAAGEPLSIGIDPHHVHLCTADSVVQFDTFDNSLDERIVRRFTPRAEHCRFVGERAITSHADGAIKVWDENGALVAQTQAAASIQQAWKMALGEQTLIASTGPLQVWDITPYGRLNGARDLLGFGRSNAYGYGAGTLIELDSGVTTPGPNLLYGNRTPVVVSDSLESAVFVEDAFRLSVAALRPGEAPRLRWQALLPRGLQGSPVVSPDERYVAVNSAKALTVFNTSDGKVVRDLPDRSLILFAPGDDVVTQAENQAVVVSLRNGTERPVPGVVLQSAGPVAAAFTRAGDKLALATGNQSVVELFEWPGLRRTGAALPHSERVTSLSVSSDGRAVLTSTIDGTSHVWDLSSGRETLRIPGAGATRAAFTPRGQIAILDATGVRVLPANPDDWIAEACRRIVRNLTQQEWGLLLGNGVAYQRTCPNRP